MSKKERGFTLIELMVVVAIIGILIAIVLPRLTALIDMARERSTLKNLKNIYAAIYYQAEEIRNGIWPVVVSDVYAYLRPEYGTPTVGEIPQTLPKAKYQRKYRIPDNNSIEVGPMSVLAGHEPPEGGGGDPTAGAGGWFYCNDTTDDNFTKVFADVNAFDTKGVNYTEYSCR